MVSEHKEDVGVSYVKNRQDNNESGGVTMQVTQEEGQIAEIGEKNTYKELCQLLQNLSEAQLEKMLMIVKEQVYLQEKRTLDQMIRLATDLTYRQLETRKFSQKERMLYIAKVKMAMYYVQNFGIHLWRNEMKHMYGFQVSRRANNWVPYLDEIANKLQMSEEEIIMLACLYHYYYIPKAEIFSAHRICEWREIYRRDDSSGVIEEISKIKDLAKLYMTQDFQKRLKVGTFSYGYGWNDEDIVEQFWRDILASEKMSDVQKERMQNGISKSIMGSNSNILWSVQVSLPEIKEKKDSVLSAYEMLNNIDDDISTSKNEKKQKCIDENMYERVIEKSGLSFEEIRILDCFTKVY